MNPQSPEQILEAFDKEFPSLCAPVTSMQGEVRYQYLVEYKDPEVKAFLSASLKAYGAYLIAEAKKQEDGTWGTAEYNKAIAQYEANLVKVNEKV